MKPKILLVLSDCIDRGLERGYSRAHKHVDNPSKESLLSHLEQCIMEELHDYFEFDNENYS